MQVKTHTSALFSFHGSGIEWFRSLKLPYFPLVVNLNRATADLHTLNTHRLAIQLGRLDRLDFVTDELDTGSITFPLGKLMTWSLSDCAHKDFPAWAFSVLQPAVHIEMFNVHYARFSRFFELKGRSYRFKERMKGTLDLPNTGETWDYVPVDVPAMLTSLRHAMGPLAYAVSNTPGMEDKSEDLLEIRRLLRGMGVDPDPRNEWDEIARGMDDLPRESVRF